MEALLAALALVPLDREPGARLRVVFRPTFHATACITLREGELELVWAAAGELRVVTVAAEIGPLPPFPDGDVDLAARDGIEICAEMRTPDGIRSVRATSPVRAEAPEHHRFFAAVLALAARHVTDAAGVLLLAELARYLH